MYVFVLVCVSLSYVFVLVLVCDLRSSLTNLRLVYKLS